MNKEKVYNISTVNNKYSILIPNLHLLRHGKLRFCPIQYFCFGFKGRT